MGDYESFSFGAAPLPQVQNCAPAAARAAVRGAYMNVRTNARGITDHNFAADIIAQGKALEAQSNLLLPVAIH